MPRRPLGDLSQRQRDNAHVWFDGEPSSFGTGIAAMFAFWHLHDIPLGPPTREQIREQITGDDVIASLGFALILEDRLQLHTTVEQTTPAGRRFGTAVLQWHAALPFTVAERGRLLDVHRSLGHRSIEKLEAVIDLLPKAPAISGGVRQTSYGPDLHRRWLAWREQRDEFADQGSLIQARYALRQMVELCDVPEGDLDLQEFRQKAEHPAWYSGPR